MATSIIKQNTTGIRGIVVTLNSSGSIAAGGNCAIITTDVSSQIPEGYKMACAYLQGTQNNNAFCWYQAFSISAETVSYRLRNVGSSALTVSPTAHVICVPK